MLYLEKAIDATLAGLWNREHCMRPTSKGHLGTCISWPYQSAPEVTAWSFHISFLFSFYFPHYFFLLLWLNKLLILLKFSQKLPVDKALTSDLCSSFIHFKRMQLPLPFFLSVFLNLVSSCSLSQFLDKAVNHLIADTLKTHPTQSKRRKYTTQVCAFICTWPQTPTHTYTYTFSWTVSQPQ